MAGRFHPPGHRARVVTVTEEEIGPHRTADGTAFVLADEDSSQRPFRIGRVWIGHGRGYVKRRAERMDALIDGDARIGRKSDTFGAGAAKPRIAEGQLLEEDKRTIFLHDRLSFAGMLVHPRSDRLHRDLLLRDLTFFDERPADGRVRPAVLRGVGYALYVTILEPDASGSLDLQEEDGRGIIREKQDLRPIETEAIDLSSRRIGNEMPPVYSSRDLFAAQCVTKVTEIDLNEIIRNAIDGRAKSSVICVAAPKLWLVIAGEEPLAREALSNGEWNKILLEPVPCCDGSVGRRHAAANSRPIRNRSGVTASAQLLIGRQLQESLAGSMERLNGCARIAG